MADMEVGAKSEGSKISKVSHIILRSLVICTTLAATLIIVSAKQSVDILGITMDARYSYSPAFKFFAFANAIACGFCLLSVCLLCIPNQHLANYILFLHDLFMMSLVLGGCAGATAIGYVGQYGNSHTGWSPICDNFGKFCERVKTSVVISYVGVLCLLLLTITSASYFRKVVIQK